MNFVLFGQTTNFILKPLAWVFSKIIDLIYNGVVAMMDPNNVGVAGVMGVTIILFTVLFRVLLFPLSLKQQRSSRQMQRIQPKIQRVQDKYKGKTDPDSTRLMQEEMNAIYKENKTSPFSGCLPLLIQMPILFVLYEILRNTAFYISEYGGLFDTLTKMTSGFGNHTTLLTDNFGDVIKTLGKFDINTFDSVKDLLSHFSKENWGLFYEVFPKLAENTEFTSIVTKTQALNSFLGFNLTEQPGLSFPQIIWPILAGVTTWLQTFLMTKTNDKRSLAIGVDPKKNSNNSTMKTMNLIMPFFMAFIMLSVPLGIGLYWIVGNIYSIFQQFLMDWIIDKEEYKAALVRKSELEEKLRLKEIAKSNIDQKTGKRIGTLQQQAANRSALAGNRKVAAEKRAESGLIALSEELKKDNSQEEKSDES